MAKVIVMPKLGYTQDTGSIAAWLKNEGDTVERGEALFDAHTDKTVVTVESNCSGTVLKIALEPEITVPVLTPVAVVGEPGEDAEAALANYKPMEVADAQDEGLLDDDEDEAEEKEAPQEKTVDVSELKLSRRAKKYVEEIKGGVSVPLEQITSEYHYHTVTADSKETLDEIQEELQKQGYLVALRDYEPVDFWSGEDKQE